LTRGPLDGGTALTRELAEKKGKPLLIVDLCEGPDPVEVVEWARQHGIGVVNIAGPRESSCEGIQAAAAAFLRQVLAPRFTGL
jgi:hypothetical protein